jgi:hypothetical protein
MTDSKESTPNQENEARLNEAEAIPLTPGNSPKKPTPSWFISVNAQGLDVQSLST